MNLREQVLLIKVTISKYSTTKTDKEASRKVAEEAGARKAGRFHKQLFAESDAMRETQAAFDAVRQYIYNNTLPWMDGGFRIRKSEGYMEFLGEIRARITQAESKLDTLCEPTKFETECRLDAHRLNGLARLDDYPSHDDMRDMFSVTLDTMPMPNTDDFRLMQGLTDEAKEALREEGEDRAKHAVSAAMTEAWNGLRQSLSHLRGRVQDKVDNPKTRFHESTITNLRDYCNILQSLNIANDPDLTRMGDEILREFTDVRADAIRETEEARRNALSRADELLAKMAAFKR